MGMSRTKSTFFKIGRFFFFLQNFPGGLFWPPSSGPGSGPCSGLGPGPGPGPGPGHSPGSGLGPSLGSGPGPALGSGPRPFFSLDLLWWMWLGVSLLRPVCFGSSPGCSPGSLVGGGRGGRWLLPATTEHPTVHGWLIHWLAGCLLSCLSACALHHSQHIQPQCFEPPRFPPGNRREGGRGLRGRGGRGGTRGEKGGAV